MGASVGTATGAPMGEKTMLCNRQCNRHGPMLQHLLNCIVDIPCHSAGAATGDPPCLSMGKSIGRLQQPMHWVSQRVVQLVFGNCVCELVNCLLLLQGTAKGNPIGCGINRRPTRLCMGPKKSTRLCDFVNIFT